jgi:hypothetical protein
MIELVLPDPGRPNDIVGPPSTVATPDTTHAPGPPIVCLNTKILPVFEDAAGKVIVFVMPPGLPQRTV